MNYELIYLVGTYCVVSIFVVATICVLSLLCSITTTLIDKITHKSKPEKKEKAKSKLAKKWDIKTNDDDKKKEA